VTRLLGDRQCVAPGKQRAPRCNQTKVVARRGHAWWAEDFPRLPVRPGGSRALLVFNRRAGPAGVVAERGLRRLLGYVEGRGSADAGCVPCPKENRRRSTVLGVQLAKTTSGGRQAKRRSLEGLDTSIPPSAPVIDIPRGRTTGFPFLTAFSPNMLRTRHRRRGSAGPDLDNRPTAGRMTPGLGPDVRVRARRTRRRRSRSPPTARGWPRGDGGRKNLPLPTSVSRRSAAATCPARAHGSQHAFTSRGVYPGRVHARRSELLPRGQDQPLVAWEAPALLEQERRPASEAGGCVASGGTDAQNLQWNSLQRHTIAGGSAKPIWRWRPGGTFRR